MTIRVLLDELRAAAPECRMVAYIDSETALVLATSAEVKPRQEVLDQLAEKAALIMPPNGALVGLWIGDGAGPDQAIILENDSTLIFVRSLAEPSEVICCTCSSRVTVEHLITSAREALVQIARVE